MAKPLEHEIGSQLLLEQNPPRRRVAGAPIPKHLMLVLDPDGLSHAFRLPQSEQLLRFLRARLRRIGINGADASR